MIIVGKYQRFKEGYLYFVRTQNICSPKNTDDSLIMHEADFVCFVDFEQMNSRSSFNKIDLLHLTMPLLLRTVTEHFFKLNDYIKQKFNFLLFPLLSPIVFVSF